VCGPQGPRAHRSGLTDSATTTNSALVDHSHTCTVRLGRRKDLEIKSRGPIIFGQKCEIYMVSKNTEQKKCCDLGRWDSMGGKSKSLVLCHSQKKELRQNGAPLIFHSDVSGYGAGDYVALSLSEVGNNRSEMNARIEAGQ